MIDGTNGVVSHKNLAKAKMNSSWACDTDGMRMLVVGDIGKGCLFDISMGANDEVDDDEPSSAMLAKKDGVSKKRQIYKSPPKFMKNYHSRDYGGDFSPLKGGDGTRVPMKWKVLKDWFVCHRINKMDPNYVVTVKYIQVAKVFATGTTNGEVKLWDNQYCTCLGTINSPKWDPTDLKRHMELDKLVKSVEASDEEAEPEPVIQLSDMLPKKQAHSFNKAGGLI